MSVAAHTRLGPYEIIAPIGAGGMGEVYRARDTRLGREVAVKVLPAELSNDAERLRRFEQEACAAGALSHPNILSIYDVGAENGAPYVVSELLEGETLRGRLEGAPLPQRKAVEYALQIARGLSAAHERGIVHRDLKPENLFITRDGRVKILDFGLAKLVGRADGSQSQTDVPTRRIDTEPGVVMGTVGYMSPEQVRGVPADHRTDIFSFGAVLYEMLTGRRAFQSESVVETLNSILKEDPPGLAETNRTITPALARVVEHCLEKNPEQRFQSARDLAFALEALSGSFGSSDLSATTTTVATLPPARSERRERLAWIIAAVALLLAALSLAVPYLRRAPKDAELQAVRFVLHAPHGASITAGFPRISPDGSRVLFRAIGEDAQTSLWMRALDSFDARALPGTAEAGDYFWSPDSRYVAFALGGKLKKMDAAGGPAQTLCDAPQFGGGAWNRDGTIVFSPDVRGALYRVSAEGGAPSPVTTLDESRGEYSHTAPTFLPDGRRFLYLARGTRPENDGVYVGSLDSREAKRILSASRSADYAPPGYLLFLRETTLMAQRFDADRLELTGEPQPVARDVSSNSTIGVASTSVSDNGVLVYRSVFTVNTQLVWFDRAGKRIGEVGSPGFYGNHWLSPDGRRVATGRYDPESGNRDIWIIELERGTSSRLTFGGLNYSVVWSPDNSRIAFISNRAGATAVYQKLASGAGGEELLLQVNVPNITDWSADGRFILYQTNDPRTLIDLWALPLAGDRRPFPLLQSEFNEGQGRFSPDGRLLAYVSNESGRQEVYVQNFPPSGGKWQISTGGGSQPMWRRDGRELFYVSPDNKLMAAEVRPDSAAFESAVPRALFDLRVDIVAGTRNSYVAGADGNRFLVNTIAEELAPSPFTVVVNWPAGLRR